MHRALAAAFVCAALAGLARAESLVVSLTEDFIRITSNFSGSDIVMFGAIESPDAFKTAQGRDIVVVIRGPEAPAVIRRKGRVAGVWVNADAMTFEGVPGFYFIASTAPLESIAAPAILQRYQLGANNLTLAAPERPDTKAFRQALITAKSETGLFGEDQGGIQLTGAALFQARVRLPANVPVGQYTAEAYLFRDGQVVSAYSALLYVDKSGLERTLFNFAHENSVLYGLGAILAGVLMGFGAAFLFRERN